MIGQPPSGLAEERFGSLDILVNNAAINLPSNDNDAWNMVMDVNVRGVHLGIQHSIPAMKRAGGGSIVNISSVAGLVGRKATPYAYTASKGAVRLLTKGVAIDYAADNIRCNSIHPGTHRHRHARRHNPNRRAHGDPPQ